MKIRSLIAGVLLLAVLAATNRGSLASPPVTTPGKCSKIPSNGEERSRSVARFLFADLEQYWEIAETRKPLRDLMSLADDPSADGSKLEFHDVQFETFQAGFYRYPDASILVSSLSTTSAKFKLPCGLAIGQSQKHVGESLGSPTHVRSNAFIYGTGGDQNGEVILEFRQKKLWRVSWQYDTH
jgi:hypothetical protein